MKRLTAIALVALAGLCTAGSMQAQTREVRATVPFNFIVNGRQLPAGPYQIVTNSSDHLLLIRNRAQAAAAQCMIMNSDYNPKASNQLVFTRYGDRYFLREIHSSEATGNSTIPASKLEKQAQRLEASVPSQQVLVALGN